MKNTGERLIPNSINETFYEHIHRYALAQEYVVGKIILDIASGEGYGSNLLAQKAKYVTGVDISNEAIEHAKEKYNKDNLQYIQGSVTEIPLPDGTIDVVVSFETIEHLEYHNEMLMEIKRVLKKNGILIISSPDKLNYSDIPNYKNPFHVKELYADEFEHLISKYFSNFQIMKQKLCMVSIIVSKTDKNSIKEYSGTDQKIEFTDGINKANYLIAIASDFKVEYTGTSIFNAHEIYEQQIKSIEDTRKYVKYYLELTEQYKNSSSYKIGKFLLSPISLFLKLFKK